MNIHEAIAAFTTHLRARGKESSAHTYAAYLLPFAQWLDGRLDQRGVAVTEVSTADLVAYQCHVAERRHQRTGKPLSSTTRATRTIAVVVLFRWLHRHDVLLHDPAASLRLPRASRRLTVAKDHLSQQEVIALLQTQAARVEEYTSGSLPWAREMRNLALIALALATGRRCHGLVSLRLADLDLERGELRVAQEKGRTGRVLPVAAWCVGILRRYVADARAMVMGKRASVFLYPSRRTEHIGERGFAEVLDGIVANTITKNPDLVELPSKRISTHSLRVSFASMLFANGITIRSLNELMLHANLTTTAQYTPIAVDDLRRVLMGVHPRA